MLHQTNHKLLFADSRQIPLEDKSVDLVITSPPYPMIEMWDNLFMNMNDSISIDQDDAFELMHKELDKVWKECYRVLRPGSFICINIGDATRTTNQFRLYSNHSRITTALLNTGFINLPNIIWKHQTNSPNKFMGSGMLPCGAYVTLEHEYILIFRKPGKRITDKDIRRESAYFFEERNKWFSDIWDIKPVRQTMNSSRLRNASYPIELPFRIINMYSVYGDVVLDPFCGLFTTNMAAMLSGRNSISLEIDESLWPVIRQRMIDFDYKDFSKKRYQNHITFVDEKIRQGKTPKHFNSILNCAVTTKHETDIVLYDIDKIENSGYNYRCNYKKISLWNTNTISGLKMDPLFV